MLTTLTLLATNVVLTGHVAVLHKAMAPTSIVALASNAHDHFPQLSVRAIDINQWDPNGSGVKLVSAPPTADGYAVVTLLFPSNEAWDIKLSDGKAPSATVLASGILTMKLLSKGNYPANPDHSDPKIKPVFKGLRLIAGADNARLEAIPPLKDHVDSSWTCYPMTNNSECEWQPGSFLKGATDRVKWTSPADVTVEFMRHGTGANPKLLLKAAASLTLSNHATEVGSIPPPDGKPVPLNHLKHYYSWLKKPVTPGKEFVLVAAPAVGPIFCPPVLIEHP